jgi:hypothetical protein
MHHDQRQSSRRGALMLGAVLADAAIARGHIINPAKAASLEPTPGSAS